MTALFFSVVWLLAQGYPTPQPVLIDTKVPVPAIFREPATRCTGIDPELTQASVKSVARVGKNDQYTLTAQVKNVGMSAEPAGFPQRVDVYRDGHRVASVPVAPLTPEQARSIIAVVNVPQAQRHPYFTFRLSDGEAQLPAPKRCQVLHDRFEIHL